MTVELCAIVHGVQRVRHNLETEQEHGMNNCQDHRFLGRKVKKELSKHIWALNLEKWVLMISKQNYFTYFEFCKGQGYLLLRIIKLCMCIHACSDMSKTLCDPMNCSPPASSVHGIFQARILEWVAYPFSRGSFWPRDQTLKSFIGGQILFHCTNRDHFPLCKLKKNMSTKFKFS